MKIQFVLTAGALAFLFGCATPRDMRNEEPTASYTSAKPSKNVAICIADKWENGGAFGTAVQVAMRPTVTGYTAAWVTGIDGVGLFVDIDDVPPGSRTRLFKHGIIGIGSFQDSVSSCQ